MAYTALPEIQRRMELARTLAASQSSNTGSKSGSITSGLANAINQFRSGRLAKQATEAQSENEKLRTAEMQRLAQALSGGAAPPLQAGVMPSFSTPEVQDMATRYQMEEAQAEAKARRDQVMRTPSMGLSPVWAQDAEGNYIPMQMSSAGGMSQVPVPEGLKVLPNAGTMGYDPSLIALRGAAQTGVDVRNIQATTEPTAARAGAVEAAQQAAQINSIIPKAEEERSAALVTSQGARASALASKEEQTALINDLTEQARDLSGFWTTGFVGGKAAQYEGTPAFNLARTLDTLQASAGFDTLQQMKSNSPTGSALGAVSDTEMRLLQATWGSLEQAQSQAQFERALDRFQRQVNNSWDRINSAYERDYGTPYFDAGAKQSAQSPSSQPAPSQSGLTPEEQSELDLLRQQYGRP